MLTPLPCDFIFRDGAPDILCVHGASQIEILKSKLNWPENRLFLIKSLRFRIENNRSLSGKIFLPLTIVNKKRLIKAFKNLLINCSPNSFIKLDVMNHPAMLNSEKHISLKTEIENLYSKIILIKILKKEMKLYLKKLFFCFNTLRLLFKLVGT